MLKLCCDASGMGADDEGAWKCWDDELFWYGAVAGVGAGVVAKVDTVLAGTAGVGG